MTEILRKPAVFSVDDPRLVVARPEEQLFDTEPPAGSSAVATPEAPKRAGIFRGVSWGALFWSALSGLVLMGLGLAVTNLVEDLFARAPWLGAIGLALASIAGLALLAVIVREIAGLVRLSAVESLRDRALEIIASDDREAGKTLTDALLAHTKRIPQLARARARLEDHRGDIIDGRDRVHLAERELMAPLDVEARRLVASAAKRVSVVTAISPRASVDMIFVLLNALNLVRRLAVLYGGRPRALGLFKLFRQVLSHLAVTGGVSVTDSVVQQVVGHGIAARLSARFGEGLVNGLLTARLGLLAIDLSRPLPFAALPRPALNDLVAPLMRTGDSSETPRSVSPSDQRG
jgi:putative membrane protein